MNKDYDPTSRLFQLQQAADIVCRLNQRDEYTASLQRRIVKELKDLLFGAEK